MRPKRNYYQPPYTNSIRVHPRLKLTQHNYDVFDEVMNGSEDVWAALDGHARYNNEGQNEPGEETND